MTYLVLLKVLIDWNEISNFFKIRWNDLNFFENLKTLIL